MTEDRSDDWFAEAEADFAAAKTLAAAGHWAQACFAAQQAAEKAMKSWLLAQGARTVNTHSLMRICHAMHWNGELERAARLLDRYYLTSRYPDTLPGSNPSNIMTLEDASEALGAATTVLNKARDGRAHAQ